MSSTVATAALRGELIRQVETVIDLLNMQRSNWARLPLDQLTMEGAHWRRMLIESIDQRIERERVFLRMIRDCDATALRYYEAVRAVRGSDEGGGHHQGRSDPHADRAGGG